MGSIGADDDDLAHREIAQRDDGRVEKAKAQIPITTISRFTMEDAWMERAAFRQSVSANRARSM